MEIALLAACPRCCGMPLLGFAEPDLSRLIPDRGAVLGVVKGPVLLDRLGPLEDRTGAPPSEGQAAHGVTAGRA